MRPRARTLSASVITLIGLAILGNVVTARRESPETAAAHSQSAPFIAMTSPAQGNQVEREKNGGVGTTPTAPFQLTSSISFTTLAPGGQASGAPWIQLYSNALRGGTITYPTASQATCTTTYQVLVIDRQTLAEKSYACYDTDAALSNALAQLVPADPGVTLPDLVVVGTTLLHNAGSDLDTTDIGGTDYSKSPAALRPQGYMIIGIGGASGGASESYYLSSWLNDDLDPNTYLPQLNGLLTTDADNNYVFHPTNNTVYSVVNTPGTNTGPFQITVDDTVGSVTYTPPPDSADGFWLLALKRTALGNLFSCDTNVTPTPCGAFYQTGNSNTTIAEQQANLLASALSGASSEQLLFLVSIGTPLSGTPPAALLNAVEFLGGAAQTLLTISQNTDTYNYTLISSNDPAFSKIYPGGNVVVSSNINTAQGQTGSVYGVLSRGLTSLYVPVSTNQGNVLTDAHVADESLYQIAWQQPGPWPAMDTVGRLGAYRYLSYMVTSNVLGNDAATDDIRSQYPSSNNTEIATNGQPRQVPFPASGTWTDIAPGSVDNGTVYTFTQADMTAVATQLALEFSALVKVGDYMNGTSTNVGLRPTLVSGNTATVLAMIGAAATAGNALSAPSSAKTTLNPAAMANILRASTALLSVVVPEAAPVLSVASAMLWLSTATSPLDKTSTGIPSPFNDVSKTLEELAEETFQSDYVGNTGDAFDQMLDNIYSDWTKLDTVAAKVVTTWKVPQQSDWDAVTAAIAASSKVHFYSELLASVYAMDVFTAQPSSVTHPSGIGSVQIGNPPCRFQCEQTCVALYSSSLPSNGWVKHGLGPSTFDFLIVGGPISNNNTNAMKEKLPTTDILNTLFGTNIDGGDLNLFNDQFFATYGILPRRFGSAAPGFSGGTLCYDVQ